MAIHLFRCLLFSALVQSGMCVEGSPTKYRKVMQGLFIQNKLSAKDAHLVIHTSTKAGAVGVEDLAKCGAQGKQPGNLHRDLMRTIMKDVSGWPPFYYFDCRVLDPKTGQTMIVSMPMLLPHEVMSMLATSGKLSQAVTNKDTAPPGVWKHIEHCAKQWDKCPNAIFAMGVHGDGAPCGAHDSLEQLSWNLPCWVGAGYSPRFLIGTIFKTFVMPGITFVDFHQVIAWSFKMLALGIFPDTRHDGSPWAPSDKWRGTRTGDLHVCASLVQARGDWKLFKEMYNFPQWNCKESMCWMCSASQETMQDSSLTAVWRSCRTTANELIRKIAGGGCKPCPLFSIPEFHSGLVLPDWLHTCDIGVAAVACGNALWECMKVLEGSTHAKKVQTLWLRMQAWYKLNKIKSKLDSLTKDMLKQRDKGPKLRGKAAQVRALVPFTATLASEVLQASPHNDMVRNCMAMLAELYTFLDEVPWPADRAAVLARKFVLLYCALGREAMAKSTDGTSVYWRFKPKFHLFLELVEFVAPDQGCPKLFWTYRDEDYGGYLSKLAARKGGQRTAEKIALRVLQAVVLLEDPKAE